MTTRSPLIVLCTSPKSSSVGAVDAILAQASGTDASLVVVAPRGSQSPPGLPMCTYQSRSTFGNSVDRLVRLLDTPGRSVSARLRRGAAGVIRRRARPVAQFVDRSATPLPKRAAWAEVVTWLESKASGDRPVYVAYTDGWALPIAVELTRSLPCAGSGSIEMVSKLLASLTESHRSRP